MSFVSDILNSAKELEPPLNFWRWAALASISAVVKDNLWLPRGGDYYNLYPNIYVMFHADSGLKKGPPVSFAKSLVQKVNNTKIISGRSSIQGILKKLGTAETKPGGAVSLTSTAFICSSELTSSLVEDKAAADILTDLYDRHYNIDDWESLLKMEQFKLNKPTVTMLTATNESHANDFFAQKDVQGGYFARTFIIYETEEHTTNSLSLPLVKPFEKDKLIEYLKELSVLKGSFQGIGSRIKDEIYHNELGSGFYSDAGIIYENWYVDFKRTIKDLKVKDATGTINRFGDSVLKVAMLLSLSEGKSLIISEGNILEAIETCEKLIGNARQTTMGKNGKSSYVSQKTMIIQELLNRDNHMITRAQLLKKYWMHFEPKEWDESILPSMIEAGIIVPEAAGGVLLYVMPPQQVIEYQHFFKGKNK